MKSILAISLAFFTVLFSSEAKDLYLTYSTFIQEAQAGHIKTATLSKYSEITGTGFINGEEQSFHTYSKTGTTNDPLLVSLLNDKSVQINTATDEKDLIGQYHSLLLFVGSSMIIVPWITLVLIILVLLLSSRILVRTKKTG